MRYFISYKLVFTVFELFYSVTGDHYILFNCHLLTHILYTSENFIILKSGRTSMQFIIYFLNLSQSIEPYLRKSVDTRCSILNSLEQAYK